MTLRETLAMESHRMRISHTLIIAWLLFVLPGTAWAYLDPGTESFVLQMLVAGLLGAVLYVRTVWDRIKLFLSRLFSGRNHSGQKPLDNDKP